MKTIKRKFQKNERGTKKKNSKRKRKPSPRPVYTCSAVLGDNSIVEMVYNSKKEETRFAVFKDNKIAYKKSVLDREKNIKLFPIPAENNLIKNNMVLFPSTAQKYQDRNEKDLIEDVQKFIHKYLDISPFFEEIATYFVLFTWAHDKFNEVPYLRAIGDYGVGKSRFLFTIGFLCYKPIMAGGAVTASAIFRILEQFKGTLVIDEADFKISNYQAEIIKILNQGNSKGTPVLRNENVSRNNYNPKAFDVFGPKIVATRGHYEDKALESRFLVEEMVPKKPRADISINLPDNFRIEALEIRNKLLTYRFRNYSKAKINPELADGKLEPRLNQIIVPLLSIIKDQGKRKNIRRLVSKYDKQIREDRGMQIEGEILEAIKNLFESGRKELTMKEIATYLNKSREIEENKITSKKIGYILRQKLNLKPEKKREGYTLFYDKNKKDIKFLLKRYGLLPIKIDKGEPSKNFDSDVEQCDNDLFSV